MFNFINKKKSKLLNTGNNSKLYENLYNKRSHAMITNNTNILNYMAITHPKIY